MKQFELYNIHGLGVIAPEHLLLNPQAVPTVLPTYTNPIVNNQNSTSSASTNAGNVPALLTYNTVVQNATVAPKPNVSNAPVKTTDSPVGNKTMTLKTIVVGYDGLIPATITIDGQSYATVDSGIFQKPNVSLYSTVTISCIGYKTVTYRAMDVPAKVTLEADATQLDPVNVKPKKKVNWMLVLLAAGGIAIGINEYNKTKTEDK